MATGDRLDPFPAVTLGATTVLVDRHRPVAVLREAGGDQRVLTWPDAPLPARAASAGVLPAPGCVWVLYSEDSLDGPDTDESTAVRIDPDGTLSSFQVGALGIVGVDDTGVWVSPDPDLAMGDDLPNDDAEDPDAQAHAEAHTGPPAWLKDAPVESWEDFDRAQRHADDIRAAELTEAFRAAAALPESDGESFGWFAYPPGEGPEPAPQQQPLVPTPTGPVTLRRVHPDGVDEVVFSRVVSHVSATVPGVLRVVFHPTGPVHTPDGHGGSYVHYPQRAADIDVSAGLPTAVDLGALPSEPLEDEWDDDQWGGDQATTDDGDRVDLTGVPGTRWTPRPLDAAVREAAVAAVLAQYTGLDAPSIVHTTRDDRWHKVQSEHADVTLTIEGSWPHTEVVLDFTYLPARGRLFRRRTRVFDDAGAPIAGRYLGIYLDEDLATTDLDQLPVREGRSLI